MLLLIVLIVLLLAFGGGGWAYPDARGLLWIIAVVLLVVFLAGMPLRWYW